MAEPTRFKMSFKSPLATKLKASISRKLLDFIPDYIENDDLADYVVVLVGNGKDQDQARADLDEFLGERSAEFVTWLWDVIAEHVPLSNIIEGLSIAKDVVMTCSQYSEGAINLKTNRRREPRNQGKRRATDSLCKTKLDERLSSRISHRSPNSGEIGEVANQPSGSRNYFNELNIKEESLQHYNKKFKREHSPIRITGGDYRTYKSFSEDPHSGNQPGQKPSFKISDAVMKVSTVPRREANLRDMPSSSEIPLSRMSFDISVPGRPFSTRARGVSSAPVYKPRRSVWDRLGRPPESTDAKVKSVYDVDSLRQDEVPEEQILSITLPGGESKKSSIEASGLCKRADNECARMNRPGGLKSPIQAATSNKQKRRLDEVVTDAGFDSTYLLGEKDTKAHHKENVRMLKVSSLTTDASEDALSSVVSPCSFMADNAEPIKDDTNMKNLVKPRIIDVKQRLRQVEKEMADLQRKQEEIKSSAKCGSIFGAFRTAEEYVERTTVVVTNVHFAATRKDLWSYFEMCGSISNVVILTDPVTALPMGSACITFKSMESVESAVKLNGSSFFSRIIKVCEKDAATPLISAQAQFANNYFNSKKSAAVTPVSAFSRLQWRRPSFSTPRETSTSTTIEPQSGPPQSSS